MLSIVTSSTLKSSLRETAPRESDLDRVLKLIPAEVISLYITARGLSDDTIVFPLVLFGLALALVPTILALDARRSRVPAPPLQYVLRTLAFVVWAFAVGQPLAGVGVVVPDWVPGLLVLLIPILGARLFPPSE